MRVQGMSMDGARGDSVADTACFRCSRARKRLLERTQGEDREVVEEAIKVSLPHSAVSKCMAVARWAVESKRLQCSITDTQETE